MRTRRVFAIVLAVVTLPFLLFGLIDPLEGGIVVRLFRSLREPLSTTEEVAP